MSHDFPTRSTVRHIPTKRLPRPAALPTLIATTRWARFAVGLRHALSRMPALGR